MKNLSYYKRAVKKLFLLSLVLFQFIDARSQNKYGIMLGTGKSWVSKINGSVEDHNRYSARTSFWGGLTASFPLGANGLSVSTAALYDKKGYNYSLENSVGANNAVKDSGFLQDLNYVDINLLLLKKFSLDEKNGFFIGAGPVMNIFVSGKEQTTKSYFGTTTPPSTTTKTKLQTGNAAGDYKRIYPSMSLVAGAEFNRISISVNYNLPLDYYYLDAKKQLQHSMKTFGVSIGYALFAGKKNEKEPKEKKEKKEKTAVALETAKIDSLADTDGDGIVNIYDKCPGHKGIAKYGGCPVPDADGDGINDDDDKCPMVAGPLSNSGCPLFADPNYNNNNNFNSNGEPKDTMHYIIYFEQASSQLRTEGFNTLSEVVRLLKNNPDLAAQFNGHTDNVGSVEANSIRAFDRAMVCVDYVSSFFIERKRLTAAAFSNKKPVADLNDRLLQWKNRRVEVLVFKK